MSHIVELRRLVADWLASPPPPLLLLLLGPLVVPLVIFELAFFLLRSPSKGQAYGSGSGTATAKSRHVQTFIVDWPSAMELAAQIRRGELSSRKLTEDCIKKIECERANAVTAVCFEAALKEADAADAAVASGSVPADHRLLWGVPIVIKECFEMPGLPFTAGIGSRI